VLRHIIGPVTPGAGHVIGRPVGCECYIVDPDDHHTRLPPTTVGELVVGGPGLAACYLADPVRTANSFFHHPPWADPTVAATRFYRTGDLASIDGAGDISIQGRKDNQIKVRGQRINVEEIEQAVLSTDHVHQAVVVLPKAGVFKNKLTAVVSTDPDPADGDSDSDGLPVLHHVQLLGDDVEREVRSSTQKSLPAAFVPAIWLRVTALPCTSSLKVDRGQVSSWLHDMVHAPRATWSRSASSSVSDSSSSDLSSPDSDNSSPSASSCSSYSKSEQDLLDLWSRVLDLSTDHLRPHASFIRNGGDSITAMDLRRHAKARGIHLEIKDILSCTSLPELLQSCSTSRVGEPPLLEVPVSRAGTSFPLAPVQQCYLDVAGDGPRDFAQSISLEVKELITEHDFRRLIHHLVTRHPTLASQFHHHRHDSGAWSQIVPHVDHHTPYHITCESLTSAAHARSKLPDLPSPTFDLSAGSLFHAHYIRCEEGHVFIKLWAHHLAVDLVSWRVILEDLEGLVRNEVLPAPTMSFQTWCALQEQYVDTLNKHDILPYSTPPPLLDFWTYPFEVSIPTDNDQTYRTAHSMLLAPQEDGSVLCTITFNHAIIDGGSRAVLLRELANIYTGRSASLDTLDYRDHLRSLTPDLTSPPPTTCIFPTRSAPTMRDVGPAAILVTYQGARFINKLKRIGSDHP
jgi:aryl carrier-like protein